MNIDDSYRIDMTVNEWRGMLTKEDDCYRIKTTVNEWRWLLLNKDD